MMLRMTLESNWSRVGLDDVIVDVDVGLESVDDTTVMDMNDGLRSVDGAVETVDDGTFDVESDCGI